MQHTLLPGITEVCELAEPTAHNVKTSAWKSMDCWLQQNMSSDIDGELVCDRRPCQIMDIITTGPLRHYQASVNRVLTPHVRSVRWQELVA